MATLHIENEVKDYGAWKAAFDKFDRVRADNGVVSYRVTCAAARPSQVYVDLDFASVEEAARFTGILERIWSTPQSESVLVRHNGHQVREVLDEGWLDRP